MYHVRQRLCSEKQLQDPAGNLNVQYGGVADVWISIVAMSTQTVLACTARECLRIPIDNERIFCA